MQFDGECGIGASRVSAAGAGNWSSAPGSGASCALVVVSVRAECRAPEVVDRGDVFDRAAGQPGGQRPLRPADAEVSGHMVSAGDLQELPDFIFDGYQDGGQGRAEAFGPDGEDEV